MYISTNLALIRTFLAGIRTFNSMWKSNASIIENNNHKLSSPVIVIIILFLIVGTLLFCKIYDEAEANEERSYKSKDIEMVMYTIFMIYVIMITIHLVLQNKSSK